MSSLATPTTSEPENFESPPNSDSDFPRQNSRAESLSPFTTEFNNPSNLYPTTPLYSANMPESTKNSIAGTTDQSRTIAFQVVLRNAELRGEVTQFQVEVAQLQEKVTNLQGENARLSRENAQLRGENTRLHGDGIQARMNRSEVGQKLLLILVVVLLACLLLGYTFSSRIIDGLLEKITNAKNPN